jgi:hypothetical protein
MRAVIPTFASTAGAWAAVVGRTAASETAAPVSPRMRVAVGFTVETSVGGGDRAGRRAFELINEPAVET